MKKNYYAKALALTVAASMVSVPAFAAEGTDDPQAQEETLEQDEQKGEKSAEEEQGKTEQLVKEEKIEDGISAASDDDQETAVAEGEVFAKGDDCGATEEDEVSWELVKNNDTLYRKAEENGYSYATTAEDGYEEVDGYTLTISGFGDMKDYYAQNVQRAAEFEGDIAPWRRALLYDTNAERTTQEIVPITKVEIGKDITRIGSGAFAYTALTGTVTFSENVHSYGDGVFAKDALIQAVDWTNFKPENIKDGWAKNYQEESRAVPYAFFDRCTSLDTCIIDDEKYTGKLVLPENIETICVAAFRGTAFDTVDFSDGLKHIRAVGGYAISGLAKMKEFTYPGNVDFYSTNEEGRNNVIVGGGIEKLIISKEVTKLPSSFCTSTENLTTIEFENGAQLKEIGENAFYSNSALESINIPSTVTSIGKAAFADCFGLKEIELGQVEFLGENVFARCSALETVKIQGTSDTTYPSNTFSIWGTEHSAAPLKTLEIGAGKIEFALYNQKESIETITLGDGVTEIPVGFADGCVKLTSVSLPDAVTAVPDRAFRDCTALTEVKISKDSNLQSIGKYAFQNTALTKMYIPKDVTSIGECAFYRTPITVFDMSDVLTENMTVGQTVINNWYSEGEKKPVWKDDFKYIYVSNSGAAASVKANTNVCKHAVFVTNGGKVDTAKTGFEAVFRPGYTAKWYQTADFSDTAYTGEPKDGGNYYAKWTLNDSTNIEVTYNANISGVTAKTYAEIKGNEHLAKASSFNRAGYTFTGWNTAANGTGTAYAVGDIIPTTANITVYAQWKLDAPTVSVTGNATKQYDGADVTLTAATPVSDVTYQWQKDGEAIEGATKATYTVKNVADSGSYTVKITDADGKTAVSSATAISITKKEVAVPTVKSKTYNGTVLTADVTATADYEVTKNEGRKNAGVYDVILTLKDAENYKWADSEEAAKTIPFTVAPKKVELTVDNSTLKGAGSVTFTVDGVCNGDTAKVVCDVDSIKVESLKASLPNATMEYTFTTDMGGNYEPASCVVSVTRRKSGSSSSDTSAPTYGVSTGKTENGEISVTPAKAEAGETVTIKATPDSGYQLDKMTVKDKNNSTVKLKKVNENEYTFTMPVGKVSVDATFVQKDAADDSNAAEAGKTIKLQIGSRIVNVDNEAVIYDVAPVIRNDRTLVPIRIITEALGGKVDWNGATKEVTLSINDKEIKMTIGKTLEKYGVAPVIIDGRTFVPVRFVADELGANVAWDDATKTVTIKTAR